VGLVGGVREGEMGRCKKTLFGGSRGIVHYFRDIHQGALSVMQVHYNISIISLAHLPLFGELVYLVEWKTFFIFRLKHLK